METRTRSRYGASTTRMKSGRYSDRSRDPNIQELAYGAMLRVQALEELAEELRARIERAPEGERFALAMQLAVLNKDIAPLRAHARSLARRALRNTSHRAQTRTQPASVPQDATEGQSAAARQARTCGGGRPAARPARRVVSSASNNGGDDPPPGDPEPPAPAAGRADRPPFPRMWRAVAVRRVGGAA